MSDSAQARELLARELDTLTDDQQQALEDAYSATGQDEFAIGRKIRWEYQEAVTRGWLRGAPAVTLADAAEYGRDH